MNKKVAISNLLAALNDYARDGTDEALESIEHIESRPMEGMLKIRFNLSAVARMTVRVDKGVFVLEAKGVRPMRSEFADGIAALRRVIYDLDELLANGYKQPEMKVRVTFFPPPPPQWMDIPVWDEEAKSWYDAEI